MEQELKDFCYKLDRVFSNHNVSATLLADVIEAYQDTRTSTLHKVAEFHRVFKHPINHQPFVKDPKIARLRVKLLEEELSELKTALGFVVAENGGFLVDSNGEYFIDSDNANTVEVLDALLDLEYVLKGAFLALGFTHLFESGFDEVQRSNMSKACATESEAESTIDFYLQRDDYKGWTREDFVIESTLNTFIVKRKDGKILKSVNYSPADLVEVMNRQLTLF